MPPAAEGQNRCLSAAATEAVGAGRALVGVTGEGGRMGMSNGGGIATSGGGMSEASGMRGACDGAEPSLRRGRAPRHQIGAPP